MVMLRDFVQAFPGYCIELGYEKELQYVRCISCSGTKEIKRHETSFEIEEYLKGRRKYFSVGLDLSRLSLFQQRVLEETRKIGYGTKITYGTLAKRTGSHPRAVGGALSRNPFPILIPCHRVVAANGMGGYSEGVDIKIRLLELEARNNL
jgi:methylated-DNA-[protein]-cysteine S-methyltransferase